MPVNYKPLIKSGFGVGISGQHVYVESGVPVVISGQHIYVESGPHVVISGQSVTISGDHVFVESGVYVIADIAESGLNVVISGQPVTISGDHVFIESGAYVVADIAESGIGVQVQSGLHVIMSGQHFFQESGAHVVIESGIGVTAAVTVDISGTPVTISGDHVFVESGAYVTIESGIGVITAATAGSGQIIHVGCAAKIRTGKLVQVVGGTSGSIVASGNTGSGGLSLCVSGYWCSGPIHTIIIKNLADNNPVYIGEVNCKPYSGYGFLLAATEAINLDYCNVCDIWIFAQTSGQYVTWIGTDY